MRATSRCQKQKEVGFPPTLVPLNLRVINGRVVHPNHGTKFSNIGTVFQDCFPTKFEKCFMAEFIVVKDNLESCKNNNNK